MQKNDTISWALKIGFILYIMLMFSMTTVEASDINYKNIDDIPLSKWNSLSNKKYFFGHQSVGDNIVDGIKFLIEKNPNIKINIVSSSNPKDFDKAIFLHSHVETNKFPETKINNFTKILEDGIGLKADVAFLKFCYVDAVENTNVEHIFSLYKSSMNSIQKKYPDLKIIHFTIPLRTHNDSWKANIKRMLGIKIWGVDDNIKRNEFNELLIDEYGKSGYLFDISKVESTLPDGSRQKFTENKKEYFSLYPGYSSDGGHLNKNGAEYVAKNLLIYLANID